MRYKTVHNPKNIKKTCSKRVRTRGKGGQWPDWMRMVIISDSSGNHVITIRIPEPKNEFVLGESEIYFLYNELNEIIQSWK